jgi:hypothetical protein
MLALLAPQLVSAQEIPAQRRAELKSRWQLAPDATPFAWSHLPEGGEAEQKVKFDRSYTIKGLPEVLTTGPLADCLSLRVVDIGSKTPLNVYHQTFLGRVSKLLSQKPGSKGLKGPMRSDFSFTNERPGWEPAFYTDLDPFTGGLAATLGGSSRMEVMTKIRFAGAKKVFLATLNEPMGDNERSKILAQLSGDPDFWSKYKTQRAAKRKPGSSAGNPDPRADRMVYNFDIFHNAVVRLLREKFGLPVDLMLFSKDFRSDGLPGSYSWPIVFDRGLLGHARVEKMVYFPFQEPERLMAGPSLTPEFLRVTTEHPGLSDIIRDYGNAGRYTDVLFKRWNSHPKNKKVTWYVEPGRHTFDQNRFQTWVQTFGAARLERALSGKPFDPVVARRTLDNLFMVYCQNRANRRPVKL